MPPVQELEYFLENYEKIFKFSKLDEYLYGEELEDKINILVNTKEYAMFKKIILLTEPMKIENPIPPNLRERDSNEEIIDKIYSTKVSTLTYNEISGKKKKEENRGEKENIVPYDTKLELVNLFEERDYEIFKTLLNQNNRNLFKGLFIYPNENTLLNYKNFNDIFYDIYFWKCLKIHSYHHPEYIKDKLPEKIINFINSPSQDMTNDDLGFLIFKDKFHRKFSFTYESQIRNLPKPVLSQICNYFMEFLNFYTKEQYEIKNIDPIKITDMSLYYTDEVINLYLTTILLSSFSPINKLTLFEFTKIVSGRKNLPQFVDMEESLTSKKCNLFLPDISRNLKAYFIQAKDMIMSTNLYKYPEIIIKELEDKVNNVRNIRAEKEVIQDIESTMKVITQRWIYENTETRLSPQSVLLVQDLIQNFDDKPTVFTLLLNLRVNATDYDTEPTIKLFKEFNSSEIDHNYFRYVEGQIDEPIKRVEEEEESSSPTPPFSDVSISREQSFVTESDSPSFLFTRG